MKLNEIEIITWPPEPDHGMCTGKIGSGIKITHRETGKFAICVASRSQHMNKRAAFKSLELQLTQGTKT